MTRFLALLAFAAVAFSFSSCDKHSWEETKVLQEKYSEHGAGHGEHGAAKEGEHGAKAEAHGEKH